MKKRLITFIAIASCLISSCTNINKTAEKSPDYKGFRPVGSESVISNPNEWGELNTHDPSIFKDGDTYYVFSTDASYGDLHTPGIQIRKSKDLITWEYVGPAFKNYETDCAEAIAHAKIDVSKKQGLWAPDIIKSGNKYRLYFSASTFGTSRSCIGLAESNKIEGPYEYKGIVIKTEANAVNGPNAIDPALQYGRDGELYMVYGSFSGGIFIQQLDIETGLLKSPLDTPTRIAGSRGAAIEGGYISYIPESDYYYLFVSYGSLSSDYNIRVARSKEISGPYEDANGNNMASLGLGNEESIGTKLFGGYTFISDPGVPTSKGYMAPGHNSALIDGEDYFLIHHVRTYTLPDYWFYMNVRRFYINAYGWPVVAPNRYNGESVTKAVLPDGDYALITHLSDSNSKSRNSVKITLSGNSISGSAEGGYQIYDNYKIKITLDGIIYDGIILTQRDWERDADITTFTAMSEGGLCIWGATALVQD